MDESTYNQIDMLHKIIQDLQLEYEQKFQELSDRITALEYPGQHFIGDIGAD